MQEITPSPTPVGISTSELAKRIGKAESTILRRAEKLGIKPIESTGKTGRPTNIFSEEQAKAIENFGKQQAEQGYSAGDSEQIQDRGYMVMAQHQQELVHGAKEFAVKLRAEEQAIAQSLARYISPKARMARVLSDAAQILEGENTEDLECWDDLYQPVNPMALIPQSQDDRRRFLECL